jgi:predicted nuclease of predicted toxin-antitoxin system
MHFLADENIARSTVVLLRSLGHNVKDAKEEKWFGFPDERLARIAKRQNRIILTLDKDFGNILVFPPRQSQGILLISIREPVPSRVNATLQTFLKGKSDRFFKKKLVILEETQARIRE